MHYSTAISTFFSAFLLYAFPQEIDTASPSSAKRFTILDQIERPKERQAFQALYKQRNPGQRLDSARSFLSAYPDSWLLAEVYDIAAKACIDIGDFHDAVAYARESLRLLPENPLLLVPMANVEVQQGLYRAGERSARDALEYLGTFSHPSSIREADWPAIKNQLEASSLYALGRVELQGERMARLGDAVADLSRAAELNPKDAEIEYLLGVAELAQHDRESAARAFAAAARLSGPAQVRALNELRELSRNAADVPPAPVPPAREPPATSPGRYAGSEVCRTCHTSQYTAWQQTGMARMFRPYKQENVFGDFTHTSQLHTRRLGSPEPGDMVFNEGGVNCEMYHGPSASHVEAMRAGRPYASGPGDPPVVFAKLDNREYLAICGQCHMQSAVREQGHQGEWNYSGSAKAFRARHTSRPLTDFSRRAFYKDGRFRETTFIGEAFMHSACYRRGKAQCGNCHNPHPANALTNPTSLKHLNQPNRCLSSAMPITGLASRFTPITPRRRREAAA